MSGDKIQGVISWLRTRRPDVTEIGWDEDLIDQRLIDSLDFPELLLLLEALVGRELELTPDKAVSLRTLGGIRDNILADQQDGASDD